MPSSADLSLAAYAEQLASLAPTPGACAVPAALAAGLVAKAARQTAAADDPFGSVAEDMEAVAAEADDLRAELLALADADALAFERVMTARRGGDRTTIEAACRAALEPPRRVCERSLRVLSLAAELAERGHPFTASDAGAAVLFAAASAESAALEVELEASATDAEWIAEEAAHTRDRARALREHAAFSAAASAHSIRT
jgi:formiminotetrahydrofolate cyclodeaminase